MKKLILSVFLFPVLSFAGAINGGGGKGVLCTGPNGAATLQLLDLYEAKNLYRLEEAPRQGDLESELNFGMQQFDKVWAAPNLPPRPIDNFRKWLDDEFFDKVIYIPDNTRLPITDDATIPVLPNNCSQVQIALYNSLGIQMDRQYWDMMDSRNRAAMVMHEVFYLQRRNYGANNSDEIRKFIGRLFSTTPPTPIFAGAPKEKFFDCFAGGMGSEPVYSFSIYPGDEDNQKGYVLTFWQIENVALLDRTTMFVSGLDLNQLLSDPSSTFGFGGLLKAELHTETRSFSFNKLPGSNKMTVSVRDRYTGKSSDPVEGFCELH